MDRGMITRSTTRRQRSRSGATVAASAPMKNEYVSRLILPLPACEP
jgi:hypothetical protein